MGLLGEATRRQPSPFWAVSFFSRDFAFYGDSQNSGFGVRATEDEEPTLPRKRYTDIGKSPKNESFQFFFGDFK